MTIVEQETMNMNPGLEAEMEGEGDLHDVYDDDDAEVEEDPGTEEDEPFAGNPEVAEWVSLTSHPAPTVSKISQCIRRVASRGRNQLTILILGRAGVGKSSTVNSIFASTVAQSVPFHMISYQTLQPLVVRKKTDGVTLTVIDSPGLIESDAVSETGLKRIALQTRNYPVDVVMFVDRVDVPRPDELDAEMMSGLTRTFGKDIWSRVVIGLTRADIKDPPPGQSYQGMVAHRVEGMREIMRRAGARDADLPYVLIENSDRCQRNAAGEKILENGTAWIPAFFETVVNMAQTFPTGYKYNAKMVNRNQQLFQKFCLIPIILVVQILVKVLILDRTIEMDGTKGDQYGPYDTINKERELEKLAEMKKRGKSSQRSSLPTRREREISLEDEISDESDEENEN